MVAIAEAGIAGPAYPGRVTIEWPEALCLCSAGIRRTVVLSFGSTALATSAVGGCTRCCTSGVIPIAVPPQPAAHGLPENPELQAVIQAWDHLPPAVRAGGVAMVRAWGG